jgi:Raf kinase inhibitor-like YbhB/YbcL family protein
MKELIIKSPVFETNSRLPKKYTCDGESISPPLVIEGTPKETKSLALLLLDPDAPSGIFDHWVVWNIPPSTSKIAEGTSPGTEGLNSAMDYGYHGPCPPSGTHRYIFKIYALDTELSLGANSRRKDIEKAMQGHILTKGEIVGLYSR